MTSIQRRGMRGLRPPMSELYTQPHAAVVPRAPALAAPASMAEAAPRCVPAFRTLVLSRTGMVKPSPAQNTFMSGSSSSNNTGKYCRCSHVINTEAKEQERKATLPGSKKESQNPNVVLRTLDPGLPA